MEKGREENIIATIIVIIVNIIACAVPFKKEHRENGHGHPRTGKMATVVITIRRRRLPPTLRLPKMTPRVRLRPSRRFSFSILGQSYLGLSRGPHRALEGPQGPQTSRGKRDANRCGLTLAFPPSGRIGRHGQDLPRGGKEKDGRKGGTTHEGGKRPRMAEGCHARVYIYIYRIQNLNQNLNEKKNSECYYSHLSSNLSSKLYNIVRPGRCTVAQVRLPPSRGHGTSREQPHGLLRAVSPSPVPQCLATWCLA